MRACTILACTLAALLAASWFWIDWTDDGADLFPGGTVVRDDSGCLLRVTLGPGDTDCRPWYEASPDDWIVKAVIASEDGTFWTHHGVRPLSVVRAACQNLFYRRRISGASTISMQAVRLIRPHPKSLWWKWREAVMAVKMERKKSKLWILSQYLNRAPFGSNLVGIEAAAQGWFGKGAKDLGLGEAALLAGMVQSPSRFRPDRALDAAIRRRDYVLGRMRELGMIDDAQLAAAQSIRPAVCRASRPFAAPHYCDWALANRTPAVPSLNAELQQLAQDAVDRAAAEGGYSAAAVIMRADTLEVKAMAVSGDYFNPTGGQFNTALALRPAGSTLKPILLALAMDRALVTPEVRLADVPKAYRGYRPANFDSQYRGLVTARDALVLSLNVPFVRLLDRVGVAEFAAVLRELGFSGIGDDSSKYGLGMAIGNVEVSLLELVTAYARVARGGDGVLTRESCYLVSDMLSGVERSAAAFGHIADVRLPRFAWKTGTSSAYRDAWTVAWNPEYVVGVWCGHQVGGFGDLTVVGAKAAAPVVWSLIRSLYPQCDSPWFALPERVREREVCALSGLPANPNCPKRERGRYIAGVSSNRPCDAHSLAPDGTLVERSAAVSPLSILKPEDGAVFTLVPGLAQQKVVFRVTGNPSGERLWWFVDGVPAGETVGTDPFAAGMTVGIHQATCTDAAGHAASVAYEVR